MAQPCDGCLGDGECWVCLGRGRLEAKDGSHRPCRACEGTGFCPHCRAAPDRRIQVHYLPRTGTL